MVNKYRGACAVK